MFVIMLLGGLGSLVRYLISDLLPLLLINSIGVFLVGITHTISLKNKEKFHYGFLGGYTSLSAIYLLENFNIITLVVHFIIYICVYKLSKYLRSLYA